MGGEGDGGTAGTAGGAGGDGEGGNGEGAGGANADATPAAPMPWCANIADRMSASMVNRDVHLTFSTAGAGVIIDPREVEVLCSYFYDGGTMAKLCDPPGVSRRCVPGCYAEGSENAVWCDPPDAIYQCAMKPDMLGTMMTEHKIRRHTYNEVVVGTRAWARNPPATIEAIFYMASDGASRTQALEAHASLLRDYPRARDSTPLVSVDFTRPAGRVFQHSY